MTNFLDEAGTSLQGYPGIKAVKQAGCFCCITDIGRDSVESIVRIYQVYQHHYVTSAVATVDILQHRVCLCVQHGEEIQTLQKRITHLETDLEQAKTQLTETNEKLDDANKNLSNVRTNIYSNALIMLLFLVLVRSFQFS